MSMLAERKRKTRYVINPTRKPLWTTDSSGIKFGKELMEKMGWSTGKGLGAKEQGIQEPLRVSYKNDNKGMGFKGNEENWIEYQDEFNSLLNQLSSSTGNTSVKVNEDDKSGAMSLEEKSKLSKARVHYQKFTRGKDLSKYSENDLSCILGTSKIKKAEEPIVEKTSAGSNTFETSFGVTTINSGSLKDYFKKKWTLNKSKNENSNEETAENGIDKEDEVSAEAVKEKKLKKRRRESDEDLNDDNEENAEVKKHKKKRRKKDLEENCLGKEEMKLENIGDNFQNGEVKNSPENVTNDCSESVNQTKNKKKRKNDEDPLHETETSGAGLNVETEIEVKSKHKKKKKEKELEENCNGKNEVKMSGNLEEPQNESPKEDSTKKKKRKKEKKEEAENYNETQINGNCALEELGNVTEAIVEKESNKKKKKKEKGNEQIQVEEIEKVKNDVEGQPVKKKKKKKDKEKETVKSNDCLICPTEERERKLEDVAKDEKKKKKKAKENVEEKGEGDSAQLESMEVGLTNQICEEKSTRKRKKNRNVEKTQEEKINGTHQEEEVVIEEESVKKKKKKRKNGENTEESGEPEGSEKKNKKSKKEKAGEESDSKNDQQATELENQEKILKKKKHKTEPESCSVVETSELITEAGNEIGGNEKTENKSKEAGETVATGEALIHTHKTELFKMKKPFTNGMRKFSGEKVVELFCGAELDKFKGSNLSKIPGYGFRKQIKGNLER